MNTIYFTICSKNFIAQALTLYESLRSSSGPVRFYLSICDAEEGWDTRSLPFPVIQIADLGMPAWESMRKQYNITELNTALKPFAFQYLFDLHPGAGVIYLDPDILVTSALTEVTDALASGSNCVLTPHIAEPAEFAEFDDQKFLQYGIYNLGFCALRDTPQVRRIVSWWGRRLEKQCVIDLANGLFVDQKWADLLPAYVDRTTVLQHPGYNVAYWNLSQRRVWRDGERWMANDRELRFFHFSGLAIGNETIFSRHCKSFTRKNVGELALLTKQYEARLHANGRAFFSKLPYAFSWNGVKGQNLHTPEGAHAAAKDDVPHWIPVERERSLVEHQEIARHRAGVDAARRKAELDLLPKAEQPFQVGGFCALCGRSVEFRTGYEHTTRRTPQGALIPNWREHLACVQCGLVSRVRAALHLFVQELKPDRRAAIYLTEQVTPTYKWFEKQFPNLQGSEYLRNARVPGEVIGGIRHEDLQALSFGPRSFDFVISFDVLEHVPFETRAFAEIFRVLKPGGKLLFTAPFTTGSAANVVRAVMEPNGEIRHLTEPEYHGNPVDPEGGALAFRYYGWEVLEQLAAAGFAAPAVFHYWSLELGYLGDTQYVFVAEKPL